VSFVPRVVLGVIFEPWTSSQYIMVCILEQSRSLSIMVSNPSQAQLPTRNKRTVEPQADHTMSLLVQLSNGKTVNPNGRQLPQSGSDNGAQSRE